MLAKETILESSQSLPFSTALFAKINQGSNSKASSSESQEFFILGFKLQMVSMVILVNLISLIGVTSLNSKVKVKLENFRARNTIIIRGKCITIQNLLFMILLLEFLVMLPNLTMVYPRPLSSVCYVLNKVIVLLLMFTETLTHQSLLRTVKFVIEVTILLKLVFIEIRTDLILHR